MTAEPFSRPTVTRPVSYLRNEDGFAGSSASRNFAVFLLQTGKVGVSEGRMS
jgi:hypothetical protein